ncbi:MAG: carbohydrate ABC transporter permease, partial [Maioricimonas sp. JB049]
GFAMLLNQDFFGKTVARGLLIIPWAIPWLFVGMVWKWFLDGQVGALNLLLRDLGLIEKGIYFLSDGGMALQLTILAAVWRQSALSGLLYLAGLQTLPKEHLEAATVDGASGWQTLRHVILPWLQPITVGVVLLNVIFGALQFDTVFAMTQGGPGDATQLLSLVLYRELFVFTDFGAGAAMAFLLGGFALGAAALMSKLVTRRNEF